jgi:uncharacterized protein YraI
VVPRKLLLVILIIFLPAAGCNTRQNITVTPASPSFTATLTFPSTLTPAPSETPLPPPPQPTAVPVEGITSTQVNVRSEPSTVGNVLGIIPPGTKVEITGRDPGGNWWQILYLQGVDGKGWVTAQYVTAADDSLVPVIGGGGGTDHNTGNFAIVQQQIHVRSGPGTGFNSLGTLNAQDVVSLTGKDASGTWLQIAFPTGSGPDGKGWVNAGFVQAQGVENLPIITEAGQVVGTGTPTGIPPTPTPTLVPAPIDNDSAKNPIVSVTFAPSGTHTLIYNGDVSAPSGDTEDWIQFVPFSGQVLLEISCKDRDVHIELIQNTHAFDQAACATQQIVHVEPDRPVQIHVSASSESSQSYSSYILKVTNIP